MMRPTRWCRRVRALRHQHGNDSGMVTAETALALPALAADPTANRLPDAGIRLAAEELWRTVEPLLK